METMIRYPDFKGMRLRTSYGFYLLQEDRIVASERSACNKKDNKDHSWAKRHRAGKS